MPGLFDVLVLDPPKLAPSRRDLPRAQRRYKALNRKALQLVKPGGLLVTCTCSAAMTTAERREGLFAATVAAAARECGREVTLLRREGAAPDHPLHPVTDGGEYLTVLFVYVD